MTRLIGVPYATGEHGVAFGRGPLVLLGGRDDVAWVEPPPAGVVEVGRVFAVNRRAAELVGEAVAAGRRPLVASGNCNACLAQVGLADGIVWLDAHGDFNTPDTSGSGFFDGMALSLACGETWDALRATIPGYRPVDPRNVVLVGVRDVDGPEGERIAAAGIRRVAAGEVEPPAERVYLHIDLDVLDTSIGRANALAVPGGLQVADVLAVIERLRPRLTGASLSAWDPSADPGGGIEAAAREILAALEDASQTR